MTGYTIPAGVEPEVGGVVEEELSASGRCRAIIPRTLLIADKSNARSSNSSAVRSFATATAITVDKYESSSPDILLSLIFISPHCFSI